MTCLVSGGGGREVAFMRVFTLEPGRPDRKGKFLLHSHPGDLGSGPDSPCPPDCGVSLNIGSLCGEGLERGRTGLCVKLRHSSDYTMISNSRP